MKSNSVTIKTLIDNAAKIVAPLWPMQTIIARNPLQGLESLPFEDAIAMGECFLKHSSDAITEAPTEINREMIKWCQVFLDEGQATIKMPEREKGFYRAWSLLAPFDNNLRSSRKNEWLGSLPKAAEEAILFSLKKLNIAHDQIEEYIKCSLAELPGWAGYIKWHAEWQNSETKLQNPITLTDFLAVRLVITCAIGKDSKRELKKDPLHSKALHTDFLKKLKNKEETYLHNLLELVIPKLTKPDQKKEGDSRAEAQLVFCIDTRSEPFRLRLEKQGNYETFGFAGFFGLPISLHSYNTDTVKDCCPVLIKPLYKIYEEPIDQENKRISQHHKGRRFLKIVRRFYQDLKYNFATPFALVETLGLWCGFWMGIRTLMPISSFKFKHAIQEKLKPNLMTLPKIDIPIANQILFAESALRMMGLTSNFSQLVVLCGHGSQTENNPYASALDCGACGGNHGGDNGKILATILNSNEVRAALLEKGISIPKDTLFIGAEHNTTTDEVILGNSSIIQRSHKEIADKLQVDLIKAGIANSQYRCKKFGLNLSPINAKKHVLKCSSNWAEVRPEWGLARNAAFIIGPRSLTKELNLDGRCFLHSYEWREDKEGKSLETILTAPMVVAEWINTQYFFSTLNNITYGSGSKVTHNITGKMGIMQGNSSDLMQGLPLQSVNVNDDQCYHEVMRLQVIVYAQRSRLEAIIENQSVLQTLFFNDWIILIAIDPIDNKSYRLTGNREWLEIKIESTINSPSKPNDWTFEALQNPLLSLVSGCTFGVKN